MADTQPMILSYLSKFQLELDPRYHIDRWVLQDGIWEPAVTSYVHNFVKPGTIAVDVGANAGYHTVLMADLVGEAGKVLAFEPNSLTREKLIRNLSLNPAIQSRVEVIGKGLGDKSETLFVSCDDREGSIGNASLVASKYNDSLEQIEVVTLDDFTKDKISFIKIDVEGMELKVLIGATEHIKNDHPIIIFETLTELGPDHHKPIEDFLKGFGYKLYNPSLNGEKLFEVTYPKYYAEDTVAVWIEP